MTLHHLQLPQDQTVASASGIGGTCHASRLVVARLLLTAAFAMMTVKQVDGGVAIESNTHPELSDDASMFFVNDPDISLISGPGIWSARAAREWFGNEVTAGNISFIWSDGRGEHESQNDSARNLFTQDKAIDPRLEKFSNQFYRPDALSESPSHIGPEEIDRVSSAIATHEWMVDAPTTKENQTSVQENPSGDMMVGLMQQCLEWEMRTMLQARSAIRWSECFDLLPLACQSPETTLQGVPSMNVLFCTTSRSCAAPVLHEFHSDFSDAADLASDDDNGETFKAVLHDDAMKSSGREEFTQSSSFVLLLLVVLLFLGFMRYQNTHAPQ